MRGRLLRRMGCGLRICRRCPSFRRASILDYVAEGNGRRTGDGERGQECAE